MGVLDTGVTDVHVQAVFVAHKVDGDLFIKCKNAFINCRAMLSPDVANIIIPLHMITGSDHSSGVFWSWQETRVEGRNQWPSSKTASHGCRWKHHPGRGCRIRHENFCDLQDLWWQYICYMWTGKVIKMSDFHRTIIHYNTTSKGQILLRIFRNITTCWITLPHQ